MSKYIIIQNQDIIITFSRIISVDTYMYHEKCGNKFCLCHILKADSVISYTAQKKSIFMPTSNSAYNKRNYFKMSAFMYQDNVQTIHVL